MSGCVECSASFFSLIDVRILIPALVVSLGFYLLSRKYNNSFKKKIGFLSAHIFFLIIPFVYTAFFTGCQRYFSGCSQIQPILVMIFLSLGVTLLMMAIIAPYLFITRYKKESKEILSSRFTDVAKELSKKYNMKTPRIFHVLSPKPFAFSYYFRKPYIFMSIGLSDILDKKEEDAVFLHELWHIKHHSTFTKFSSFLVTLFSPLARFNAFSKELTREEHLADQFAIHEQGTSQHVNSAKKKLDEFFEH